MCVCVCVCVFLPLAPKMGCITALDLTSNFCITRYLTMYVSFIFIGFMFSLLFRNFDQTSWTVVRHEIKTLSHLNQENKLPVPIDI